MRRFKQNGTFSGRLHLIAPCGLGAIQRLIGGGHQAAPIGFFLRHPSAYADTDGHAISHLRLRMRLSQPPHAFSQAFGNFASLPRLDAAGQHDELFATIAGKHVSR